MYSARNYVTESDKVRILRPLWRRHHVTKVCILPILRHGKCASSALYGADITSRKCCRPCIHYVTGSVYSPPSVAPTLRHESVHSADITSRKVYPPPSMAATSRHESVAGPADFPTQRPRLFCFCVSVHETRSSSVCMCIYKISTRMKRYLQGPTSSQTTLH